MGMQFQESEAQSEAFLMPAETATEEPVEPKQGAWLKWLLIIMAILVLAAGFFYWIFR